MSDLDRAKSAFAAWVRSLFPAVDFLALYPSRVVAQNADDTLEIHPDSAKLADYSDVPIRHGLPGSLKVPAGSRVLLGFEEGDPARPVALLWETSTITEIILGSGTTQGVGLGSAIRTELDAIWTKLVALGTHTHATAVGASGPPSSGAIVKTQQNVISTTVRAQT